jgi:hypothetical protein
LNNTLGNYSDDFINDAHDSKDKTDYENEEISKMDNPVTKQVALAMRSIV